MSLKLLIYSSIVVILGLIFAFRVVNVSRQSTVLPVFGPIDFEFTIDKEPKFSQSFQIISIGSAKIYTDFFPRYKVGDRLKIPGELDETGRIFNPKIERLGNSSNFGQHFSNVKTVFGANIDKLLPFRESTLVKGAILGVDDIDYGFRDQLVKTGTIHVVVVSGQNLAIIAGIFLSLVSYIGRRAALGTSMVACLLYAFLSGFELPVIRAVLMVSFSSLAVYLGRQIWPVWLLLISAVLIIFVWPAAVFEISFQLTFAATLGIMTLGKLLGNSLKKLPLIGQNMAVATSAYVFTAPIIIYYFGGLSLVAPIANLLVAEAVFPIMVLGFLVAFLSLIFMPLAQIAAFFAYLPAFYFVKVVEFFSKVPSGYFQLGKLGFEAVLFIYFSLAFAIFLWQKRTRS